MNSFALITLVFLTIGILGLAIKTARFLIDIFDDLVSKHVVNHTKRLFWVGALCMGTMFLIVLGVIEYNLIHLFCSWSQ